MAPTRRGRRNSTPPSYDPDLYANWTSDRLREALQARGVTIPRLTRRLGLVRLLRCSNGPPTTTSSTDSSATGARSHEPPPPNANNNGGAVFDIVNTLTLSIKSLQDNVAALSNKVDSMTSSTTNTTAIEHSLRHPNNSSSQANNDSSITFTVGTAYGAMLSSRNVPATTPPNPSATLNSDPNRLPQHRDTSDCRPGSYVRTTYGYSSESLPLVETISPQLRQNIIAGKDVNLTSLLIPYFTGASASFDDNMPNNNNHPNKSDPRLARQLSLGEFIQAFGTYKNVMCSAYPHRRPELDLYERDIVEMATRYNGTGFYEYHRQFSLRAAAHLRFNNVLVDWSVFASYKPNTCQWCNNTLHASGFCPTQVGHDNRPYSSANRNPYRLPRDIGKDHHGREIITHLGREICNNFNGERGCIVPRCHNLHVCLLCKEEHSKIQCSKNGYAKNALTYPRRK